MKLHTKNTLYETPTNESDIVKEKMRTKKDRVRMLDGVC